MLDKRLLVRERFFLWLHDTAIIIAVCVVISWLISIFIYHDGLRFFGYEFEFSLIPIHVAEQMARTK